MSKSVEKASTTFMEMVHKKWYEDRRGRIRFLSEGVFSLRQKSGNPKWCEVGPYGSMWAASMIERSVSVSSTHSDRS